jgi:hypothetical protein
MMSAGELAHRLHLLTLGKLDLEVLLLGRVDHVHEQARRAAIAEAACEKLRDTFDRPDQAHLDRRPTAATAAHLGQTLAHLRPVLLAHQADKGPPGAGAEIGRDRTESNVGLDHAVVGVEHHDADRRVIEEVAELLLGAAQRVLQRKLRIERADDTMQMLDPIGRRHPRQCNAHRHAGTGRRLHLGGEGCSELVVSRMIGHQTIGQGERADDAVARAAQHGFESGVDHAEPAAGIGDEQPERRGVDELGQLAPLLRLGLDTPAGRSDVARLPDETVGAAGQGLGGERQPAQRPVGQAEAAFGAARLAGAGRGFGTAQRQALLFIRAEELMWRQRGPVLRQGEDAAIGAVRGDNLAHGADQGARRRVFPEKALQGRFGRGGRAGGGLEQAPTGKDEPARAEQPKQQARRNQRIGNQAGTSHGKAGACRHGPPDPRVNVPGAFANVTRRRGSLLGHLQIPRPHHPSAVSPRRAALLNDI